MVAAGGYASLWGFSDNPPSLIGDGAAMAYRVGAELVDLEFNQLDLVQVQIAATYLTAQAATWGEGDWDGGPGGEQGNSPRVMLEYSGTLLYGLRRMGLDDVLDSLGRITADPEYHRYVEWLGAPWGHAVAPSTPVQDYRLHVEAWQQHFAGIFGLDALERVRGFSPSEMALPNHPEVAYHFVKALRECGYQWVLVQEHSVERVTNRLPPERPHLPHRPGAQAGESPISHGRWQLEQQPVLGAGIRRRAQCHGGQQC